MFATLTCIAKHDPRLVALAALICLAAVTAGLFAFRRALATRDLHRLTWVTVVAGVLGSGVWCTHFVAMLAYHDEMKLGFSPGLTTMSLVAAVAGMGVGVWVAALRPNAWGRAVGGAICGGAIALMHFVGVAAMQLPAAMIWDPLLVGQAVAISLGGAAAAFAVAGDLSRPRQYVGGVLLLVVAICGLHFTAMAAVTLLPNAHQIDPGLYGRGELALAVAGLAGLLLLFVVGMLAIDRISGHATFAGVRSALNQAPSAMAFFDGFGRMVFWNAEYASILAAYGITASAGLSFRAILARAAEYGLPDNLDQATTFDAFADDGVKLGDFSAPDGRWFQPRIGPTTDGGLVVLLTDITEHRAMAGREIEARQAAESANRAKGEFLANLSHEIRTPLNGVLGMAQIMRREAAEPTRREQLDVIISAGEDLLSQLNGVLDWTKIDGGKLALEIRTFDLADMVRHVSGPYASLAADSGLAFHVEIDPLASGAWRGDSARLRQVLSNLLSNALKFTREGSLGVRVDLTPDGLCFGVSDTGDGVAEDQLEHIFGAFTQVDASATRDFGGTGLGLAISRSLVELMGGRLFAVSVPGAGSTFSMLVPLERDLDGVDEATAAADPAEPIDAPTLRILIAEDNAINQRIVTGLLEPLGVVLSLVENGEDAEAAYRDGDFDLVLMDIQMPRMDGVEAARRIRAHEQARGLPRTPILALTANVMGGQIETYRRAGMDGCVAKPIDVAVLFAAIEAALTPVADPPGAESEARRA
jgi:signal transduction histidine kinase